MQSEKVNYSVKYASASHPVSDTIFPLLYANGYPNFL